MLAQENYTSWKDLGFQPGISPDMAGDVEVQSTRLSNMRDDNSVSRCAQMTDSLCSTESGGSKVVAVICLEIWIDPLLS